LLHTSVKGKKVAKQKP